MTAAAISPAHIKLKRAYVPPQPGDGVRLLVDRLWPRGVGKAEAALAGWVKEIAPSTQLRKWFGHDTARWAEFEARYRAELTEHTAALDRIRAVAAHETVTLVYGARDETHNEAVVLRDVLLEGSS